MDKLINYLPYVKDQKRLRKRRAEIVKELMKEEADLYYNGDTNRLKNDELKNIRKRASVLVIGELNEAFDKEFYGWSRTLGIGVGAPIAALHRKFFPLTMLPPDGKYLRVPDNYQPKDGEEVFDFKLWEQLVYLVTDKAEKEERVEEEAQLEDMGGKYELPNNKN